MKRRLYLITPTLYATHRKADTGESHPAAP